jgi:hypothetical protein
MTQCTQLHHPGAYSSVFILSTMTLNELKMSFIWHKEYVYKFDVPKFSYELIYELDFEKYFPLVLSNAASYKIMEFIVWFLSCLQNLNTLTEG